MQFFRSLWRGFPAQIITFAILPLSILIIIVAVGSFVLHQSAMLDMVRNMDARTINVASQRLNDEISNRIRFLATVELGVTPIDQMTEELMSNQFGNGWLFLRDDGGVETGRSNQVVWTDVAIQDWLAINNPAIDEIVASPPIQQERAGNIVVLAARKETGLLLAAFDPIAISFRSVFDSNMVPEKGSPILRLETPDQFTIYLEWHEGAIKPVAAEAINDWAILSADPSSDYIVTTNSIPTVGWQLTYIEPWQATNDPLLEATEFAPLLFVPILLAALASIWIGMKKIVMPIRQLAQQATDVSQGNYHALGDDVEAIVEIQQLQAELNRMAHQVKDAQDSLRDYVDAVTIGQEEERKRLAREIHDSTIQALIALNQRIQLLQLSLNGHARTGEIEQLEEMATQIIADLRRLTGALRPIYLEELGLVAALQMLASETEQATDLKVTCEVNGSPIRLSNRAELTLFRIAQQALQNSVKHAGASEAILHLFFAGNTISLQVADNGCGFVMPERPMTFTHDKHFGIVGMFERAELIGATLQIRSRPGKGTVVELEIKLPEPMPG